MGHNCTIPNSSTERVEKIYGKDHLRLMTEYGTASINFVVNSRKGDQKLPSSLFMDLLNHPDFTKLSLEDRGREAFNTYLEAYSDEFIKKYGDWINNPETFKGKRYPSTGEPDVNLLFKGAKPESRAEETLRKSVSFLESAIKTLETKLEKLENSRRESAPTERKDLESVINVLKGKLEKREDFLQIQLGIKKYLYYIKTDRLNKYINDVKVAITNDEIDPYLVNEILQFIEVQRPTLENLHAALDSTPELRQFFKDELEDIMKEIESDFSEISRYANKAMRDRTISKVLNEFEDVPGVTEETVENWFKSMIKDISGLTRYIGIASEAGDPVIKAVVNYIKKIQQRVHSIVKPAIDELKQKQEALNKAGFNDMSIFREEYEGERTRFKISKYKWGEYYIEQQRTQKKLIEKFKKDNYTEVVAYINQIRYDDPEGYSGTEEYKFYKKAWDSFYEKYTTRDEKGVLVRRPPINKEFEKLIQNQAFKEYYEVLDKIHIKTKERQPYKYRSGMYEHLLPQIRKDTIEGFTGGLKEGLRTIKREAKESTYRIEEDVEFGGIKRDKDGNVTKIIPLYYNTPLDNINDLSNDITSMYYMYYNMAENFRQRSEAIDDLELIHRMIGHREIETKNAAAVVENLINTQIYGETLKDQELTIGNKKFKLTKILKLMLVKYPSTVNMFMNIPVTTTSALKGDIDRTVETFVGSQTTRESARKATTELTKNWGNIMLDVGKKNKSNKIDLMILHNNIEEYLHKNYQNLNLDTKAARMMTSDLMYASFMPVAYRALSKTMLSVYFNYRLINGKFTTRYKLEKEYQLKSGLKSYSEFKKSDLYKDFENKWKESEEKSLYNAYEVKDGKFQVKEEYKKYISKDFEDKIAIMIQTMSARLEGKLNSIDKGAIYNNVFGQGIMLHRAWIPQLTTQRFKDKGWNLDTGMEEEGFYRTVIRMMDTMLFKTEGNLKTKLAVWQNLEDFEKRNLIRFTGDLTFMVAVWIIAKVMNKIADDDDEDSWMLEYMAYQTNRLLLEQGAFYRPVGIFDLLKSPAPALNQLEKIGNIWKTVRDYDEEIESGAYKGKQNWERFMIQQFWLKNLYELQYPKVKNTWLKTQQL